MLKCSDSKHQEGQPVAWTWTTSAGHVQPFHEPFLGMTVNVLKQFEVKTVQCLNAFSRTPAGSTNDKYPSPNRSPRPDRFCINPGGSSREVAASLMMIMVVAANERLLE